MYRPGYIYLHRYMCHIINISPKSSSCFFKFTNVFSVITTTSEAVRASHLHVHELAGHNLQFSVAGCSVFSVIWPKYHIIKDSALRTSYLAVT